MVRPFNATVLTIFLLTTLFADDIFAEKADRGKPLIINADTVKLDDVEQKYNLIGDILLTKGSMLATGDDGLIVVDPQGYENINLKAAPRSLATLRTRREGLLNEYMQGIGKNVLYDGKKERVIFIGDAKMKRLLNMQMLDELQGAKIEYEDIKESYKVSSPLANRQNLFPQSKAILAPRSKAPISQ